MTKDKIVHGQSGDKAFSKPCSGDVTIVISGPKGSGKALVAKFLEANLPLLPVDTAVIRIVK